MWDIFKVVPEGVCRVRFERSDDFRNEQLQQPNDRRISLGYAEDVPRCLVTLGRHPERETSRMSELVLGWLEIAPSYEA